MAVYRASHSAGVRSGFTEHDPAQTFGLGKQDLGKYIVCKLKTWCLCSFLIVVF